MLKVCWDCLFGNGQQTEVVNGTALNGHTVGSIAQRENEMAYKIPRPLQNEDVIEVKGLMRSNPERICIALMTGQYNIDYNNVACEVEARFIDGDNMVLRTIVNGQMDEQVLERERPSDLLPAEFTFAFKLVQDYNSDRIEIAIGQSHLAEVDLKHSFQDISYVTLSHDILKVNELIFKFN
ncbi:unnamed protein product [Leptosia nina]|uniref:Galectin n=1 Tax=Leptosia nina TaxID=320188 RepID=A0AAV1JC35_9NEOP